MHIPRSFMLDAKSRGHPSTADISSRSTVATSTPEFSTSTKQMLIATILIGSTLIISILIYVIRYRRSPKPITGTTPVTSKVKSPERDVKSGLAIQEKPTVLLTDGFRRYSIHSPASNGYWAALGSPQIPLLEATHSHSSPEISEMYESRSPHHFRPSHVPLSGLATPSRKQPRTITEIDKLEVNNDTLSSVSSMTHESAQFSYIMADGTQTTTPTSDHRYLTTSETRSVTPITTLRNDDYCWPQLPRPAAVPRQRPISYHSTRSISSWLRTHPHKPLTTAPGRRLRTLKNQACPPILAPSRHKLHSSSASSSVKNPQSPTSPTYRGRGSGQSGRPPMRRVGTLSSIFRPISLKSFRTGTYSHAHSHSMSSRRASTVLSGGWI